MIKFSQGGTQEVESDINVSATMMSVAFGISAERLQ